MKNTAAVPADTIIIGGAGNDTITVDNSVTFDWVPDPRQQYVDISTTYGYDADGSPYRIDTRVSGTSNATGTMTFDGVSASEPFQSIPSSLNFQFTDFGSFHPDPQRWSGSFSWNPTSNMLQSGIDEAWGNSILAGYVSDQAYFDTLNGNIEDLHIEYGHWALAPSPRNVEVFGGTGNDTIHGSQGDQLLSGDDGNDVLFGGLGNDTLLGGSGNDVIHGGSGDQILMGGDGRDLLQAGLGSQTVFGGAGNDTIRGGVGAQLLMGDGGRDYIQAGRGNETLLGGVGRDVFALGDGVQGQIVIGDFTPAEDLIEVARGMNGLVLNTPRDLATHVSSNTHGDAVINLGGGTTVSISHISAQRVDAHLQDWFKVV